TAAVGANAAVAAAADAKKQADGAKRIAHGATVNVSKKQQGLKAEAAKMNKLYNALSEKERQEALAAQEKANEEAAAKAQAAAANQAAADRSRRDAAANNATTNNDAHNANSNNANNNNTTTTTNNNNNNTTNNTTTTTTNNNNNATTNNGTGTTNNGTGTTTSSQSAAADQAGTPSASAKASGKAAIAVQAALSKAGDPYVFGASGPNEFDCSGLTSWAWAQAGVSIPRTSADQANLPYVPLDQLQPGDLITYYSPVHHVAMYIGNGQIINASTSSKPVSVMSMYYNNHNPTGHRVTG
ncbi:MAG: C40 family peptidase, partial [Nakamurella sp.]